MDMVGKVTYDEEIHLTENDDQEKVQQIFDAVQSNDVATVRSFENNRLRHLCQVRRPFSSEWSSPDEECQSAYQRACLLGRTEIVKCMLDAGVSVDQIFSGGDSQSTMRGAFMFACQSRSISTIKALLDAGASVERFGSCSVTYANSMAPGIPIYQAAYGIGTWENFYPIHLAIINDDLEILKQFITATCDGFLTYGGLNPLHLACLLNRSIAIIDILLAHDDANDVIVAKTLSGKFPDEFATEQTIIDYLRPKRLFLLAEREEKIRKLQTDNLNALKDGTAYQVFIKTLLGKSISITVTAAFRVEDLKSEIQREQDIPISLQRLIYGGKELENDRLLIDYGIAKDATLHLTLRLVGGFYH